MSSLASILSAVASTAASVTTILSYGATTIGASYISSSAEEAIYTYMDNYSYIRPVITGLGDELTLLASMETASAVSAFMPSGLSATAARAINTIVSTMTCPNIEGIPIRATRETTTRNIDVSESTIIVQTNASTTSLMNNANPHPREWQLEGYLASISGALDAYFLIKPTITMQAWYLDVLAKSRRPVNFKTHDNTFHKVLIKEFTYSYSAERSNAIEVTLTLREFAPVTAYSSTLEELVAETGTSSILSSS